MHKILLFMIFIIVAPLSSYGMIPFAGMIEKKDEQPDCPICFEPLQMPATLKCNHAFCNPCLTKWAIQKTDCPMCRKTFNLKDYHQPPTRCDYMRHYSAQFLRGLALGSIMRRSGYASFRHEVPTGFFIGLGYYTNRYTRSLRDKIRIGIPIGFGHKYNIYPTDLAIQYYIYRIAGKQSPQPQMAIYDFQSACFSTLLEYGIAKKIDTPLAPLMNLFDDPLKAQFPAITRYIDRCADRINEHVQIHVDGAERGSFGFGNGKELLRKLTNVSSLSYVAGFFSGLFGPLIPTLLRSSTEYITPYVKEGFSKSYQLLAAYIATMRKP